MANPEFAGVKSKTIDKYLKSNMKIKLPKDIYGGIRQPHFHVGDSVVFHNQDSIKEFRTSFLENINTAIDEASSILK